MTKQDLNQNHGASGN